MPNPRWVMIDDDGGSEAVPSCFPGDPLPFTPAWAALILPVAIAQVDQYGFLGFPETRQHVIPLPTQNWDVCPWDDFCHGPRIEGTPQPDRYVTRWQALMSPNALATWDVYYGRVGGPLLPAPVALFPAPLPTPTQWLSLSFDIDARPCFAWDNSLGQIELRRFVAGVPTVYNFAGTSPRLFYDGVLQFDNTQTDLICLYTRLGNLYVRFQRDNFGVEYTLATVLGLGLGAGIDHLTKTDAFEEGGAWYQRLYLVTVDATPLRIALRSAPYPPWPVPAADVPTAMVTPAGGAYVLVVVGTGPYSDAGTQGVTPAGGEYRPLNVSTASAEAGTQGVTPAGGAYVLVVIATGPYSDAGNGAVTPAGGNYPLIAVSAGTYSDAASGGVTPAGGAYA